MSSGPTPVFKEPMSYEQALAGMLSAALVCVGFAFELCETSEARRDMWEAILDRAGIETGGHDGPIERFLFKDG